MAVKIGHASKDENGTYVGGAAGDQTGKEVCTLSWWNNSWTAVFRPKDSAAAGKIATAMERACANSCIGYDQNQRTTLFTHAQQVGFDLSRIITACECDCSSLVAVCVNAAGIPVSKTMYTAVQKSQLTATGAFTVLTESKYLSSANYLKRGDILLSSGHTAVVLSDGAYAESGTKATISAATATCTVTLPLLYRGMSGEAVKAMQTLLIAHGCSCGDLGADGDFGGGTYLAVRKFQQHNGLGIDGVVGTKTWAKLLGLD